MTGREGHYKEYLGEWVKNERSGKEGFCRYWNGDAFVGEWLNDKWHGKGIFISAKGDRTEGTWVQDQLEGHCIVYLSGAKKRFY